MSNCLRKIDIGVVVKAKKKKKKKKEKRVEEKGFSVLIGSCCV